MDIGIWGMGRMGFNMVRRLEDKGDHRVIAGNRSSGKVDDAVEAGAEGAYSVEEFVDKQQSPRVLWSMLPAGETTDRHDPAVHAVCRRGRHHRRRGELVLQGLR